MNKKDPVLRIKRSVLEQKLQESYKKGYETAIKSEGVDAVFAMLLGLPLKVLKDKYGWGIKKRLPEFAEAVIQEYQRFDADTESIEQMQQFIFDETGIRFDRSD